MPAAAADILAERDRIARIQIRCGIQFRMAPLRGIRAQAAQPPHPRPVAEHIEMGGVGTVDHVIGGRIAGHASVSMTASFNVFPVGSLPSVSTVNEIAAGMPAALAARATPIASLA